MIFRMKGMQALYRHSNIVEDLPLRPSIFSAGKTILSCCRRLSYRPPTIPSWARFYRYFTATWAEGTILYTNRILVFLLAFDNVVKSPIKGICWLLDELYHSYHNTEIKDPVFLLSAGRSGSSQMEEYLEDDKENFITPMKIGGWFPYIWVWRIFWPGLKMLGLDKRFKTSLCSATGEEYKKHQHANSLYKGDTWEILLGSGLMFFFSVDT